MTEKPRIVLHVTDEAGKTGTVDMVLNESGLKLLIEELQSLKGMECGEHFHLFAPQWGMPDGPLRLTPYYDNTEAAGHLKVTISPDKDDEKHFPDVFAAHQKEKCEGVDD